MRKNELISEDHVIHLCGGQPIWRPHTIICRYTRREVEQVATDVRSKRALYDFMQPPAPIPLRPQPGTYAFTSRVMVDLGLMSGDEADRWKDEMKDRSLDDN
jgi:hypothetical protein